MTATADESSNREKGDEANNEKSQQEDEGQTQGQSENQVKETIIIDVLQMEITSRN